MKLAIADYVALSKAGYTAEEIATYTATLTDSATATAQQDTDTAANKPETPHAKHAAPTEETPASDELGSTQSESRNSGSTPTAENDTQSMLRELLGLVKAGNINHMSYDNAPAPDAAEMMASILAPTRPKKE